MPFFNAYVFYAGRKSFPESFISPELLNQINILNAAKPGIEYGNSPYTYSFEHNNEIAVVISEPQTCSNLKGFPA